MSYTPGTFFAPTGLTGATAASRYVGATVSGPPASGTFAVGDWIVDQSGIQWVCTTAGSPGVWNYIGDPPVKALGSVSGSVAIDWRISNRFSLTMSGATTLTFTAPITPKSLKLFVTNSLNYVMTFPTILRSGGVTPVITTTSGSAVTDLLAGEYDGTSYYLANVLPNVS